MNQQLLSKNMKQQQMIEDDDDEFDLRRGPWTADEDFILINYIAHHGEGRWNSLARFAGLKRIGKSCRLRWLNYLRPDVRRGSITLEEQLLILELHSRWGNRWSKIAQHLPGRTDNEIKNYWRTRVQKHAKQLKCDVNSKQFKDTVRYLWMPRLVERIQAAAAGGAGSPPPPPPSAAVAGDLQIVQSEYSTHSSISTVAASSDSFGTPPISDPSAESSYLPFSNDHQLPHNDGINREHRICSYGVDGGGAVAGNGGYSSNQGMMVDEFDLTYDQQSDPQWVHDDGGYSWNVDDEASWFLQNQFGGDSF